MTRVETYLNENLRKRLDQVEQVGGASWGEAFGSANQPAIRPALDQSNCRYHLEGRGDVGPKTHLFLESDLLFINVDLFYCVPSCVAFHPIT